MSEFAVFAARFHPVFVHLPIGALLVAAVLEALARTARWSGVRPAITPIVAVGAVSAIVAAATGYLLGQGGGYAGATFEWHQRAGVTTALCSVAAALGYLIRGRAARPVLAPRAPRAHHPAGRRRRAPRRHADARRGLPDRAAADVARRRPARPTPPARIAADVRVYAEHRQAGARRRSACACHGAVSPRGSLRLDTPDGIRKGGESGAAGGGREERPRAR